MIETTKAQMENRTLGYSRKKVDRTGEVPLLELKDGHLRAGPLVRVLGPNGLPIR